MPPQRLNPNRVKINLSYSASELAQCLGIHKNTVRHWQSKGLRPIDNARPALFHGANVRAFLVGRRRAARSPCPPGTLYCLKCRQPRSPALGMVDYVPVWPNCGDLHALCAQCETRMHRRARMADLSRIMPGITVQFRQGQSRLNGRSSPSLDCDLERQV